jgi:hypothetical protein
MALDRVELLCEWHLGSMGQCTLAAMLSATTVLPWTMPMMARWNRIFPTRWALVLDQVIVFLMSGLPH